MPAPEQLLAIFSERCSAGPIRPMSDATVALAGCLSSDWDHLSEESRALLLDVGALLHREATNARFSPGASSLEIQSVFALLARR
jgi:hypothetical protein